MTLNEKRRLDFLWRRLFPLFSYQNTNIYIFLKSKAGSLPLTPDDAERMEKEEEEEERR